MANILVPHTITGTSVTLVLNDLTVPDGYIIEDVDGLDGAPRRATMDDAPQTDGGLRFTTFLGPRHVTYTGRFFVSSADPYTDCEAYADALEALEDAMTAALDDIVNTPGDLTWSSKTLADVTNDVASKYSGPPVERKFIFGLVAEDPTIT